MNKTKPTPKKPPAHEVILARLEKLSSEISKLLSQRVRIRRLAHDTIVVSTNKRAVLKDWWRRTVIDELLTVLDRMHLPEQERPKILAALRKLNPDIIGVHRVHVRLLKRLSGHSPAHVMGETVKKRRRV